MFVEEPKPKKYVCSEQNSLSAQLDSLHASTTLIRSTKKSLAFVINKHEKSVF